MLYKLSDPMFKNIIYKDDTSIFVKVYDGAGLCVFSQNSEYINTVRMLLSKKHVKHEHLRTEIGDFLLNSELPLAVCETIDKMDVTKYSLILPEQMKAVIESYSKSLNRLGQCQFYGSQHDLFIYLFKQGLIDHVSSYKK